MKLSVQWLPLLCLLSVKNSQQSNSETTKTTVRPHAPCVGFPNKDFDFECNRVSSSVGLPPRHWKHAVHVSPSVRLEKLTIFSIRNTRSPKFPQWKLSTPRNRKIPAPAVLLSHHQFTATHSLKNSTGMGKRKLRSRRTHACFSMEPANHEQKPSSRNSRPECKKFVDVAFARGTTRARRAAQGTAARSGKATRLARRERVWDEIAGGCIRVCELKSAHSEKRPAKANARQQTAPSRLLLDERSTAAANTVRGTRKSWSLFVVLKSYSSLKRRPARKPFLHVCALERCPRNAGDRGKKTKALPSEINARNMRHILLVLRFLMRCSPRAKRKRCETVLPSAMKNSSSQTESRSTLKEDPGATPRRGSAVNTCDRTCWFLADRQVGLTPPTAKTLPDKGAATKADSPAGATAHDGSTKRKVFRRATVNSSASDARRRSSRGAGFSLRGSVAGEASSVTSRAPPPITGSREASAYCSNRFSQQIPITGLDRNSYDTNTLSSPDNYSKGISQGVPRKLPGLGSRIQDPNDRFWSSRTPNSCHPFCRCVEDAIICHCSINQEWKITNMLLRPSTRYLKISNCSKLEGDVMLKAFPNLQTIVFEKIGNLLLSGFFARSKINIQKLSFLDCRAVSLPRGCFAHLRRIGTIEFNRTSVRSIDSGAFRIQYINRFTIAESVIGLIQYQALDFDHMEAFDVVNSSLEFENRALRITKADRFSLKKSFVLKGFPKEAVRINIVNRFTLDRNSLGTTERYAFSFERSNVVVIVRNSFEGLLKDDAFGLLSAHRLIFVGNSIREAEPHSLHFHALHTVINENRLTTGRTPPKKLLFHK